MAKRSSLDVLTSYLKETARDMAKWFLVLLGLLLALWVGFASIQGHSVDTLRAIGVGVSLLAILGILGLLWLTDISDHVLGAAQEVIRVREELKRLRGVYRNQFGGDEEEGELR
jgi:hypothetical protein